MSLHVHRNSFNAGELSPLMDARVDEAKHSFSCRIMENFLPKIYGGAFRRPGTMYLGTLPTVAEWTERTEDHASNLLYGGENTVPNASDDNSFYEIGSLWVRDVAIPYICSNIAPSSATWTQQGLRHDLQAVGIPGNAQNSSVGYGVSSLWVIEPAGTIYKCNSITSTTANWDIVSQLCYLTATDKPGANNDSSAGFTSGSLWLIPENGALWICTDASAGAATWFRLVKPVGRFIPNQYDDETKGYEIGDISYYNGFAWKCTNATEDSAQWSALNVKHSMQETRKPTTSDNGGDGFSNDSIWVWRTRTLYECTSAATDAATWATVGGTHNLISNRYPIGSDGTNAGYAVGSIWVDTQKNKAYELTSAAVNTPARFVDFNLSATERRVIEMRDGFIRIWDDNGVLVQDVINNPGNPLVLVTPYSASQIFDVQIAQIGNLAYFCHPAHPPQKLERTFVASYFAETFTWSKVNWSFPAFRDINNSAVTAAPSVASTGFTQIRFTDNPFTETLNTTEYAGARILLSQRRSASQIKLNLVDTSTAPISTLVVLGNYTVYTYGSTSGTLVIEAKDQAGAWVALKTFEFSLDAGGRQIVYNSSTTSATELRLKFTKSGATSAGTAYLEAADSRRTGYARILNGITIDAGTPLVDCQIELPFDSTNATTEWAIEAWAEYAGYPRSVCFHEQRLWFGGTKLQPNTIWASAVGDYENFRLGAYDSDALAFTLAAQEGSAVQSMVSHESLVIFTQSEEWTAATSEQTIITPSNIFVRRQSRFGSTHRQAFVAANNLLFLQRGSRKLRQFTYGNSGAGGQASDLSVLAEHITLSGIRQLAFQQQPDPIVWLVRNDGVLLSLTYEPDQSVIAWARHTSGTGLFESVAVIYGDEGESDQVWFVVNRGGTRLLERFDPDHYSKLEQGMFDKLVYVDCAKMAEGSNLTSITGLNHLEGQSVAILAGGGVEPSQTVTSNQVTGIPAANVIIAGLPFTSRLQPSKIEVAMPDGTSQGRRHISKRATINLWKTFGAQYADDPNAGDSNWFEILNRSTETNSGSPEQLFTGLVDINNLDAHRTSVDLTIRQTLPLPCNVLAIIPKIEVFGK